MLLIDIAVPRDLDPGIATLPAAACATSTICATSSP